MKTARLPVYPTIFSDRDEAIFAYQAEKVEIRQKIKIKIGKEIIETTVGRLLFNEVLPENFDFVNEAVTSSVIKSLFVKAYSTVSQERVVQLVDDIKDLGFFGGTISGISFGIFDAKTLSRENQSFGGSGLQESPKLKSNFDQGLITAEEKDV